MKNNFQSSKALISRILLPVRVEVKDILVYREDTASLLEASRREVLVVWEILILEVSEANHVVAAPVLVEELTSTLIINLLQRRIVVEFGSMGIFTNLVEEVPRFCRTTLAGQSLSLHQQYVGKAQQRHIVRLVTAILEVISLSGSPGYIR